MTFLLEIEPNTLKSHGHGLLEIITFSSYSFDRSFGELLS